MHEMEKLIRPLSRTGPGDGPFTTYRSLLYRSLTPIVAFHTVRVSLPKLYCRKLDFANTLSPRSLASRHPYGKGYRKHGFIHERLHRYLRRCFLSLFLSLRRTFSFPFFSNFAKRDAATSALRSTPLHASRYQSAKLNRALAKR